MLTKPSIFWMLLLTAASYSLAEEPCRTSNNQVWCKGINQSYFENGFKAYLDKQVNVTAIHLTNGTITDIKANAFRECHNAPNRRLDHLISVDLSSNSIKFIDGKAFHCMPNVEKLSLAMNMWDVKNARHTGMFNNILKLKQLDLTNALSGNGFESGKLHLAKLSQILQGSKHSALESLHLLRLGNNRLEFIADFYQKTLCTMPALNTLVLSNNLLQTIDFNVNSACHYMLKKIDITSNNFNYLPQKTLDDLDELHKHSKDLTLYMYHQQWDCDCKIVPLHNWLKTTTIKVVHKTELRCYDGHNFNKTIIHLTPEEMQCVKPEVDSSIQAGTVVLIVLFILIGVAVVAATFIYRGKIQSCARNMYDPIRRGGGGGGDVQYSSVESTPIA